MSDGECNIKVRFGLALRVVVFGSVDTVSGAFLGIVVAMVMGEVNIF